MFSRMSLTVRLGLAFGGLLLVVLVGAAVLGGRVPKAASVSGAVIVDDLDAGFVRGGPDVGCSTPGSNNTNWTWCYQTICNPPYGCPWAGHYFYTWNCGPGTSACSIYAPGCPFNDHDCNYGVWTPNLPYTASYLVCAYIPPDHAYTNSARYQVHHASGTTQIIVNQQAISGWTPLGTFSFNSGTSSYVRLGDYTAETYATRQIGYDAMKWIYAGSSCNDSGSQKPTATFTLTSTPCPGSKVPATPSGCGTPTPTPCTAAGQQDSDCDGMPDAYEQAHACLNRLVADASLDPDADALTNIVEYGLGTDPCNPDTDHDGCGDGREELDDHLFGGQRDPLNFWDYYDTPDNSNVRDHRIRVDDVTRVVNRYRADDAAGTAQVNRYSDPLAQPPAAPGYSPAFDRGASSGPHVWNLTAANGLINVLDVTAVVNQYRNDCV